jgi:hypothetical protein
MKRTAEYLFDIIRQSHPTFEDGRVRFEDIYLLLDN